MKTLRIFCALVVCFAMADGLSAQSRSRRTRVTFSAPFELPAPNTRAGIMALPPGTYVFSLVDSNQDRHIVRVTDVSGKKVYSTILAIADYRLNASSKTVMYFSERAAGAPVAIKSWFYPGDNFGQRFIYPKARAVAIAVEAKEPVPSFASNEATISAPVQVATPAKGEVAYDATLFAKADAADTQGVDGEALQASGGTLPTTASPLYSIAGAGLLLLAAALTLGWVSATKL